MPDGGYVLPPDMAGGEGIPDQSAPPQTQRNAGGYRLPPGMQPQVQASNRLASVSATSPSVAAGALQDGPTVGLHPDVAVHMAKEAAAQAKANRQQQVLAASPPVSKWVAGATDAHAAAAQDSLGTLATVAGLIVNPAMGLGMAAAQTPWGKSVIGGALNGLGELSSAVGEWRTQQNAIDTAKARDIIAQGPKKAGQFAYDEAVQYVSHSGVETERRREAKLVTLGLQAQQTAAKVGPQKRDWMESLLYGAGGFLPALGAGALDPALMVPVFAAQGYHSTFKDALAHGKTPAQAHIAADQNATVQGIFGAVPFGEVGGLVGKMGGNLLLRTGAHVLTDAAIGGGMQVGSNLVAQANYDPDRPWSQGVAESAAQMGIAGLISHGLPAAFEAAKGKRPPPGPREYEPGSYESFPREGISPEYDGVREDVAHHDAEFIGLIRQHLEDSPLHKESPETVENFLQSLTDQTVHVDPDKIMELAAQGHELFPQHARDIASALIDGSQVEIPLSRYLAETAGKPYAKELDGSTTFRQNSTSIDETKEEKPTDLVQAKRPADADIRAIQDSHDVQVPYVTGDPLTDGDMHYRSLVAEYGEVRADEIARLGKFGPYGKEDLHLGPRYEEVPPPGGEPATHLQTDAMGRIITPTEGLDPLDRMKADPRYFKDPEYRANVNEYARLRESMKEGRPEPEKAERLDKLMEEIEGKPGVNARRMAAMLGPQLYGDPSHIASVSIKEILQNSFDAIKQAMGEGKTAKGKITIRRNATDRTITFHDNGVGMAPDLLGGKFLQIAGSEKGGTQSSGGFGIAKMLFLYGNGELHVQTMRDGVFSEMRTSGPELFEGLEEGGKRPKIQVSRGEEVTDEQRKLFPEGQGTRISIQIPKTYTDSKTGEEKQIGFPWDLTEEAALKHSPLFHDVEVHSEEYGAKTPMPIGTNFPADKFTTFVNVKFPWGTAKVYVSKEPSADTYARPLHILSNGLWQFSERLSSNPMDPWANRVPYDIYVDMKPDVKPDEAGYPFNFNRQELTKAAAEDFAKIKAYVQATYARKGLAEETAEFADVHYLVPVRGVPIKSAPVDVRPEAPEKSELERLNEGDNVEVKNGSLYVNGKHIPELTPDELKNAVPTSESLRIDQSKINPNRVMMHDNTTVEGDNQGRNFTQMMEDHYGQKWLDFNHLVGDTFRQLRDAVADAMDYPELKTEAVGLSFDKAYRGVSIQLPFSGMFVNPIYYESDRPIEGTYGLLGTMIHELAHFQIRSHDAQFPAEMQRIMFTLEAGERGKFDFAGWKQNFAEQMKQYHEMMAEAKYEFSKSRVKAAKESFKDASQEPATDGGDEGVREPVGGAGEGAEGGPSVPAGHGEGVPTEPGRAGPPDVHEEGHESLGELARLLTAHSDLTKAHVRATQDALKSSYIRPLFQDEKALGMTKAQFNAYSEQIAKIHSDAINAAHQRAMAQILRERTPEWKAKVNENTEVVERELGNVPTIQAYSMLEGGKGPLGEPIERPFKLAANDDLAAHAKDLGLPDKMFSRKGLPIEDVAKLFKFSSGAEMIRNLDALREAKGDYTLREHIKRQAKAEAERRTRNELGKDTSPESIEQAAQEHVNGKSRTDLLSTELQALGGAPHDIENLKAFAASKFKDISVRRALNTKQLETTTYKLGEKAERHLLKGETDKAFIRKQQQFVQHLMTRNAYDFRKEYQKADRAITRIARRPINRDMDQEARNFARLVAKQMGYTVRTGKYEGVQEALRGKSLEKYVADMAAQGTPVWDATPAFSDDPKKLTTQQFLDNWQQIDSLSKLGRWMKKVYAQGKAEQLADIVKQISDNATKIGRPLTAGERRRIEKKLTGMMGETARQIGSAATRAETYLYWMDGEKIGPLMKYIVGELQDGKFYFGDRTRQLAKAFEEFTKSQPKGWAKTLEKGIDLPELTYSKDKDGNPVPWVQTREQAVMLATHLGSESNFKKLTEGFGWDGQTVRDALNRVLTREDWNYVQFILDQHKALLPDIKELYRATVGLAPKDIEAMPIPVRMKGEPKSRTVVDINGKKTVHEVPGEDVEFTLPGGYRHIDYDWKYIGEFESEDGGKTEIRDPTSLGESDLFGKNFRVATPPNRYTEGRTGFAAPLNLSHELLYREFETVIHDLAYRKALIQAAKIMKEPAVRQAFRESLGPEYLDNTNRWLQDIARSTSYDQAALGFFAKGVRGFRRRFTLVQLGYNVATFAKHTLIATSHISGEVGLDKFASAAGRLMAPGDQGEFLKKFVYESSGEVRNAVLNLDRDVRETILEEFRKTGALTSLTYHAFSMFSWMKTAESYGVWLAKYEDAILENTPEDAIAIANKAVRDTQGAGGVVDLPTFFRGAADFQGELGKLFSLFTNFENTQTNRMWTMQRRARGLADKGWAGGRRDFGKLMTDSMAYLIGPALLASGFEAVSSGDYKHFIRRFFGNLLKGGIAGSMPGGNLLAQIPEVLASREHEFRDDPLGEAMTSFAYSGIDAYQGITRGDTTDKRWVQHAIDTAGYITGFPVKPVSRAAQYLWDIDHGRGDADNPGELVRGLLFGSKPREAQGE